MTDFKHVSVMLRLRTSSRHNRFVGTAISRTLRLATISISRNTISIMTNNVHLQAATINGLRQEFFSLLSI